MGEFVSGALSVCIYIGIVVLLFVSIRSLIRKIKERKNEKQKNKDIENKERKEQK